MNNYFKAQTANKIWLKLAKNIYNQGLHKNIIESRAGNTIEMLHTFFTINNPRDRWVINRFPTINPAFSIAEIVWIINGRNDSKFLNFWNSKLPAYAGKGNKYYGAYGYRLKYNLGFDQLNSAYNTLKNNNYSRQVVLQIWDSRLDLPNSKGKPRNPDIPCNIISMLKVRNNRLEWTQVLRSNDLFLGLPYNILQFTSLQEIIAGWLNIEVGSYNQLSDSLHLYTRNLKEFPKFKDVKIEKNNDILSVNKKLSTKLFKKFAEIIEKIINTNVSRQKLITLSNWKNAPESYLNLLRIILAEAARKNNYYDLSKNFISDCSNKMLKQVWNNWVTSKKNWVLD